MGAEHPGSSRGTAGPYAGPYAGSHPAVAPEERVCGFHGDEAESAGNLKALGPCKADKLVPTCVAAVAAEEAALQTAERSGEEESAATSSTRTGRQRGAAATSRIRNKKRASPVPGKGEKKQQQQNFGAASPGEIL
ncbi:unnamed protein product [Coccothraustes coccothraustes]